MFTKQPLYNPHDSAWMTTLATSRYLLDSMLLPSFLTKQGALGKAMKIMAKDESADNTWGDVALNLLGATTKNVSAERQNFLIEEAKNTLRKAWGHYEATHDPEIDKDFMDKYREYQLGIYKLDHAGEEHAGRYGIGPWQAAMYQNNIQRMKDFGHIKTDDPYALALWEMIHTKHPSRSFWASTEPPQLTPQEAAKLLKQP
jgi:hypothetical protein